MLEILKKHALQIEDGVDSAEVFGFISWVDSAEWSEKRTESLHVHLSKIYL
jgi:hypothetical protein